ncbi:MAG: flagellar protein FlaG [Candidatus Magnetominusculus sp. LBB02]|nr:flagellar protein FlaG [Candidatus Magnetominusculus sp. LBB02]
MDIAGLGVNAQTAGSLNAQAKQQTYAQPASQPQSYQTAETPAKTSGGLGNNNSVKVMITNAGKDMLNSAQQNANKDAGVDIPNKVANLAQGNHTQSAAQSGKEANDKNRPSTPTPAESALFSNSAYYSVEKNETDNTQSVVVKIVDANGNVVRQIPPEDLLKSASELNITPNNLFHALT